MKPRKFFGASSREVLRQVRDAFGPDALIVSNSKVPGGIEVVALPGAVINDLVAGAAGAGAHELERNRAEAPLRREPAVANPAQLARARSQPNPAAPAPEQPHPMHEASFVADDPGRRPITAAAAQAPAAGEAPAESFGPGAALSMAAELRSLRTMLEQQLAGLAWHELARRDPARVSAMRILLVAGFSAELSRRLTEPMPEGISEQEGYKWLVAEVNRNLVTAGTDNDIVERGGVYAVIGPTGVGKTTTTAKLAARGVVRYGADRVALLTTDTYRIGAHEQLRIYGRILGVTTCAVKDAAELKAVLADLRGKHMVLIDTVGVSQRDRMVAEQVATIAQAGGNVKRLLLLNATCNGDTLEDVVRCYDPTTLDGCILTKVDEAQSIGAALDVIVRHRLALHFIANGQRVPEDLHAPNRQYLIHRALRAGPERSPFGLDEGEYPLLLATARQVGARASDAVSGGMQFGGGLG